MDIKSKIASFEAHNRAVRSTTRAVAPSVASTTSMASHSRRERLQREVKDSPSRQSQEPQQTQPPSAGSLAERRRVRQLQKQKRLTRESSASPVINGYREKEKSKVPPESAPEKRRSKRPPETKRSSQTNGRRSSDIKSQDSSQRRYVHTLSNESSDSYYDERGLEDVPLSPERRLSPAKAAKVHRMHRRKHYHEEQDNTPPRMTDFNQSSHTASPSEPTDDEVTLTSVRQIMQPEHGGIIRRRSASSSTIETDGEELTNQSTVQTNTQAFLTRSALGGADDERTFDYGEWDDRDDGSVTYEQRKEAERKAKEAKGRGFVDDTTSPLLNTEDVSYYRQVLDTQAAKVTVGIVTAGTVGCLMLGPVGLLVGAAVVGIGVGAMQIPEEQREHVKNKTVKALHQAHESAVQASEAVSSSCAASCHDLGCVEHFPSDVKEFFENPITTVEAGNNDGATKQRADRSTGDTVPGLSVDGRKPASLSNQSPSKMGKKRAACLRNARIVPVDQIHSLEPFLQPRAWLDVMASANTTRDEKSEGIEEILILAKDKRHARFFLEEGILDSIMWIITRYDSGEQQDAQENAFAKLAAQCCVTLGKAHCALVHTEGDLQLMSLYERGLVPEERQVAQMIHEIPHHVQVAVSATEEVFVLKQLPMAQAEELAQRIMALANGQRQ